MNKEFLDSYIEQGNYTFTLIKRQYKENLYDLCMIIENTGYRIASYNVKTERLIIPYPKLYIPSNEICETFINACEEQIKGEKNG